MCNNNGFISGKFIVWRKIINLFEKIGIVYRKKKTRTDAQVKTNAHNHVKDVRNRCLFNLIIFKIFVQYTHLVSLKRTKLKEQGYLNNVR